MRTKMTVPRAAAQERGGIKRKDLRLRKQAADNFRTLPIRAWIDNTAELLKQARDWQIEILDKKGHVRKIAISQIVEMVICEYQIQAYDNVEAFISGMAERNKEREGGLGEPFSPVGPFKKAKAKK